MHNREAIQSQITTVMSELFELDASDITLESRLYEDLDIDSIDAVDLMVELKKLTGKKIKPEDFKSVRSLGDIVDAVEKLMNT